MKFKHHHLVFELNDEWLRESQMECYHRTSDCYVPAVLNDGRIIQLINIDDIAACEERAAVKGVFCDQNVGLTARERVVSILNGIRQGQPIEPIEIRPYQGDSHYQYQMHHGSHRLHCSIAVGFTRIPAVWAWSSLRKQGLGNHRGSPSQTGATAKLRISGA